MAQRCSRCNKEKHLVDICHGAYSLTCPQCGGLTGLVRHLLGWIETERPRTDLRVALDHLCVHCGAETDDPQSHHIDQHPDEPWDHRWYD